MYEVKVREASYELTKREIVKLKNLDATKFDDVVPEDGEFNLTATGYAVLDIHNDQSKDRLDYCNYLVFADDGKVYCTGSPSFWERFVDIYNDLEGEDVTLKVYKQESKNRAGKYFLTCTLV